jgi:hypothetical protein
MSTMGSAYSGLHMAICLLSLAASLGSTWNTCRLPARVPNWNSRLLLYDSVHHDPGWRVNMMPASCVVPAWAPDLHPNLEFLQFYPVNAKIVVMKAVLSHVLSQDYLSRSTG